MKCGVTHEEKGIQLELSELELNILDNFNIPYSIIINDLTTFYKERAIKNLPKAIQELEREKESNINLKKSISSITLDNQLQYSGCTEIDWNIPTNFNLGTMGGCLTISQVESELDDMHNLYPNLISVKQNASPTNQTTYGNTQGTTTWSGQTIYYVRITGDQSVPEGTKPQTLYTSMIHAREVSSLMSNVYFMWYLLENYATDPAIKNLVDNNELYFIPVVNPDGLRWNEHVSSSGGGMQRKNLRPNTGGTGNTSVNRGVDLNRNFDYFWGSAGSGSTGTPTSDSYRGPSAFSEPEAQILRDFVLARNFQTCLMNHSYANAIPHPYGGNPAFTSGREDEMHKWHEDMTKYNRYVSGATIFSAANGIVDDWMVGGNTDANGSNGSGQNILATTPEHGGSGFWPNPTDIVPIAKNAVRIYLLSTYYGGKYAKLHDLTQSDINTLTSNLTFGIERLGQTDSDFTLTITPISANIANITSPSTVTGMSILEQRNLTAQLILNSGISTNEKIEYNVKLKNGDGIVFYDVDFEKYYQPNLLFVDNPDLNGTSNWTTSGGWVTTTVDAYSGTTSIKDGTAIPYANSSTKTLTTSNTYDLSGSNEVLVQFYTKWDIERNFDFVEILGSTNGTNWTPLCGKYNKPAATSSTNNSHSQKNSTSHTFQNTNSSGKVYDGDQMDKWVMEEIVIDASNNTFLLNATTASFRFIFKSDTNNKPESYSTTYDGFFIDDFKIMGITLPCVIEIPSNVVTSSIGSTTATISWDSVQAATYDLRYKVFGSSTWSIITNLSNATYNITSLSPNTQYEVEVRSTCGSNSSDYSTTATFTTSNISYCASNGNNTNDEYISNVTLNTINNNSGVGTTSTGYSNFSSTISTNLSLNTNYTISVSKTWTGTIYDESVIAWIDYNRDGDFDDPSEEVFNSAANQITPVIGNFTVPASATLGNTRMRVSLRYNTSPTSCGAFDYGEVEDYEINITDATLGLSHFLHEDFIIFPNPFNNSISIKVPSLHSNSNLIFQLLDIRGRRILDIKNNKILNNTVKIDNLTTLPKGVYLLKIIDFSMNKTVVKRIVK